MQRASPGYLAVQGGNFGGGQQGGYGGGVGGGGYGGGMGMGQQQYGGGGGGYEEVRDDGLVPTPVLGWHLPGYRPMELLICSSKRTTLHGHQLQMTAGELVANVAARHMPASADATRGAGCLPTLVRWVASLQCGGGHQRVSWLPWPSSSQR